MNRRSAPKKDGFADELVLRTISAPAKQISPEEAKCDADTTTADDYDNRLFQALREREREIIGPGYGGIQHPTARIFEIGVDSIRAGKPSELFLVLLESIGKMAEERDVMAELFPETFRRRIKTSTVRAAQREAAIVEKFKAHIQRYLNSARRAKVTGNEEAGGEWAWVERTYAEAVADFKLPLDTHERKAFDRALKNQGPNIIEWRDVLLTRSRKAP